MTWAGGEHTHSGTHESNVHQTNQQNKLVDQSTPTWTLSPGAFHGRTAVEGTVYLWRLRRGRHLTPRGVSCKHCGAVRNHHHKLRGKLVNRETETTVANQRLAISSKHPPVVSRVLHGFSHIAIPIWYVHVYVRVRTRVRTIMVPPQVQCMHTRQLDSARVQRLYPVLVLLCNVFGFRNWHCCKNT